MKKQNVMMAAIAIAMHFPISVSAQQEIARAHNADEGEVMAAVSEILSAKSIAAEDMKNSPK